MNEQRSSNRTVLVCKIFDCNGKFLGFSFDLSMTGIKIIVNKEFSHESPFNFFLNNEKDHKVINSDVIIKAEKIWRHSLNEDFDEIGVKIIEVNNLECFKNLIDID